MSVLAGPRNRGVRDVFFVVCGGLEGLPGVVASTWPAAVVQACTVRLTRSAFRLASERGRDALRRDVRPACAAVNAAAARAVLDDLAGRRGTRCRAVIRLRENAGNEFTPFPDYDVETRRVICPTVPEVRGRRGLRACGQGRSGPA